METSKPTIPDIRYSASANQEKENEMKHMTTWRRWALAMTILVAWTATIAAPSLASPHPQEDPAPPAIEIRKLTNGVETASAPGLSIPAGQKAVWTYVITNTGGMTLYNLQLADSSRVSVTCAGSQTLASGEMIVCGASMIVQPGPFRSQGLVAAVTAGGVVVDDMDAAFHTGTTAAKLAPAAAAIAIEKLVDGLEADSSPGPALETGESLTWTYVVTNTGGVTLTGITLTDSQGTDVSCLGTETLEPGESMVCGAADQVAPGPYRSMGTATGADPDGNLVSANDPAYYVGI
jgi:hypothetical protein